MICAPLSLSTWKSSSASPPVTSCPHAIALSGSAANHLVVTNEQNSPIVPIHAETRPAGIADHTVGEVNGDRLSAVFDRDPLSGSRRNVRAGEST